MKHCRCFGRGSKLSSNSSVSLHSSTLLSLLSARETQLLFKQSAEIGLHAIPRRVTHNCNITDTKVPWHLPLFPQRPPSFFVTCDFNGQVAKIATTWCLIVPERRWQSFVQQCFCSRLLSRLTLFVSTLRKRQRRPPISPPRGSRHRILHL